MFLNSSKLDLIKFLKSLDNSEKLFLFEVLVLAKLLIVIPAANTGSECLFSALKKSQNIFACNYSRLNNFKLDQREIALLQFQTTWHRF